METVRSRRHGLETRVGRRKLHVVHWRRQSNVSLGVQFKRNDTDKRGSVRKRGRPVGQWRVFNILLGGGVGVGKIQTKWNVRTSKVLFFSNPNTKQITIMRNFLCKNAPCLHTRSY